MVDFQLYDALETLPSELHQEVKDFIHFLKIKYTNKNILKEREFGSAKGFFVMQDDFDEPLDDFKEYR